MIPLALVGDVLGLWLAMALAFAFAVWACSEYGGGSREPDEWEREHLEGER